MQRPPQWEFFLWLRELSHLTAFPPPSVPPNSPSSSERRTPFISPQLSSTQMAYSFDHSLRFRA